MKNYPFEVKPIAGAIGAELYGIDVGADLSDDTIGEIRRALLEYQVIFFRDQDITPAQHSAFTARFGELDIYPFVKGLDDHPEIIEVSKKEDETVNFGGFWHTDTPYLPEPSLGSILLARQVPPFGGDTEWANTYLAYNRLSPRMKDMLEGLQGINSAAKGQVAATRVHRAAEKGTGLPVNEKFCSHPIVRTHPETGRKALYCSPAHVTAIEGMTVEESAPILNYLFSWQVRSEFTCRFRWDVGSIAFWDNRASLHNPINDYHGYARMMHRTTLKGDRPQ